MIKVYLVEDQALVRDAVAALLSLDFNIEVIGQASNGQDALNEINALSEDLHPDIVLTDIEMPSMNGIELSEQIAAKHPAINMVIMTTFSRAGYIRRSLSAGVKGFILKEAPSEELINALKKVMQGQKVIDPELAINALDDTDPLTDKERKALKLASDGLKTSEIAKQLYISEGTTRNYLSDAIAKLNATNRIDAARIARQKGWL
ncbi:MAG: two-component system response regulator DesR [Pseudoalteromonas tetraodonis]|jgi:two-component system response regulator DesR|uniref:DNA-binding response regulator n=5 Tax=Pseudoalteromonas TaxID=53246 RepID=A0AA37W442_9GAMM|nr:MULTISPECIES: response regulator transcription factor [Pseudoalteromonas]PHQ94742.1 MAG: DNA-binding response regulator [Pseudoalteromonas sp.]ADT67484.1 response regulator receiver domain protein (CheY-like) [Pseudoalteromonas sp. SM9913]ATD02131.1 two-component system, NarL family, response regulator DesR [Pseudoalteromonas tetraodonis]KYL32773.1 DNA-binding response regulator [Pseudoalteromonas spiralis]MDN3396437.1 response regulator transcription factor [Pseudoalteromonas sp. APC 3215]|tara:strand:+ start:1194 stop:1808 length:615 start_codon:yes stop_codon:yes gene_type:complete